MPLTKTPSGPRRWRWVLSSGAALVLLLGAIYVSFASKKPPATTIAIPETADWVDFGSIFTEGSEGEWDRYLYGGFTGTAVKKDGIIYLYYQGANGYSEEFGTVTWRAIGVAASADGLNFTKHPANPLIEWFPHEYLEEGAVSAGAFVLDDMVHLVYGANTEQTIDLVNADGRLATAADAIHFNDQGIILNHTDPKVWASGDELFPVIAFEDNGRYFIYYIPNGVIQRGQLGVAWGSDLAQLQTAAARSNLLPVKVWGMGGYARVGDNAYALFLNDVRAARTDVYLVDLNTPHNLGAVRQTYQFDDYAQATILLDEERRTWFMYYRGAAAGGYGVKLAPMGAPDQTPPTQPTAVQVTCTANQLTLHWTVATDPDTGVAVYQIRRNGELIETVIGAQFVTALEDETAMYTITAVNYHNTPGQPSQPISIGEGFDCP
ncbi:MAG TPA: hypothetical protein PLK31_04370 [Chloroflexota bacterium]|nr:hypothetical protein [Chloroflexota bacterium]